MSEVIRISEKSKLEFLLKKCDLSVEQQEMHRLTVVDITAKLPAEVHARIYAIFNKKENFEVKYYLGYLRAVDRLICAMDLATKLDLIDETEKLNIYADIGTIEIMSLIQNSKLFERLTNNANRMNIEQRQQLERLMTSDVDM